MLTLKKQRAEMGVINNRLERHGDQDVTAFDMPLSTLLDPDQFDACLGKGAHDRLYRKEGRSYKVAIEEIETIPLRHDLEGAAVTLHFDKSDIEFEKATLKDPTLELIDGGETQLRFKLQVRPENKHLTRLLDAQRTDFNISIDDAKIIEEKAKQAQGKLELGSPPPAKPANGEAHADA